MTSRHFVAIADALRTTMASRATVRAVGDVLARFNPRFDRSRFDRAASQPASERRPLTDAEREVFSAIRDAGNIALVQTAFNGEETAVIAAINDHEGDKIITPLAVLVTPAVAGLLTPP